MGDRSIVRRLIDALRGSEQSVEVAVASHPDGAFEEASGSAAIIEAEDTPNEQSPVERLNGFAFIIVDNANCHYERDASSAVRIIPPYGNEVAVLREEQDRVLVEWCGKQAWSDRSQLASQPPPLRAQAPPPPIYYGSSDRVEIGPRGGRFTRTSTGYRRYF